MLEDSTKERKLSLDSIPIEVLVNNILIFISTRELLTLSQTNRLLYNLIHNDESLWRLKIKRDYRFPIDSIARITGFKSLYQRLSKPQLWVWGQKRNSRLGLGDDDDDEEDGSKDLVNRVLVGQDNVSTPLRSRAAGSIRFVDLQAGGWSFHGLDINGNVWFWGTLDGEIIMDGSADPHKFTSLNRVVKKPKMLDEKMFPKFRLISCGRSHVIGVSDDDELYEWYSWSVISRLHCLPWDKIGRPIREKIDVLQISAGWDLSVALLSDHSIYCWREPTDEEVYEAPGFGLNRRNFHEASLLVCDLDSGDRVIRCPNLPCNDLDSESDFPVKIATGQDFIICLTQAGKVYKLDVSPFTVIPESTLRYEDSTDKHLERQRSRDRLRSAFLTKERDWQYLHLFSEPESLKDSLREVLEDADLSVSKPKITHISGKHLSFVAYCVESSEPNKGMTGDESYVFFGTKETQTIDKPTVLPRLQRRGVIQVCSGDHHHVALLSNGQLLTWGYRSEGALGLGHPAIPHRKLYVDEAETTDVSVLEDQLGLGFVKTPQLVQTFSGIKEHELRREISASLPESGAEIPRRFVFLATAAGWHTGCLALQLDEEDEDYGLAVLKLKDKRDDVDEIEPPRLGNQRVGLIRPRVGFAGRFMGRTQHH
ncbi:regulator of chromosome condensation 1/beta-lactamase-inhibitor protein II [Phakopsora pachyrhizi]|uniref:Regulator of chromosome condensation 1/beta-lactamase-inhibitor protein II n=2 Tax=Phakopsora pachyrhizi TaxID=170000 RepID=A0AAV0BJ16_PHAPC|nr:regulator of chromosome condensation 1/beta-lactamase-inhibitor protein II [Phakopsora pachyrhizi]